MTELLEGLELGYPRMRSWHLGGAMSLPNAYDVLMDKPGKTITDEEWTLACQRMASLLGCFKATLNFQEIGRQQVKIFDERTTSTVNLGNFFPENRQSNGQRGKTCRVYLSPLSMARVKYVGPRPHGIPEQSLYTYDCWAIDVTGQFLIVKLKVAVFLVSGRNGYVESSTFDAATAAEVIAEFQLDPKYLYDWMEKVLRAVYDRKMTDVLDLEAGLKVFTRQNFLVQQREADDAEAKSAGTADTRHVHGSPLF